MSCLSEVSCRVFRRMAQNAEQALVPVAQNAEQAIVPVVAQNAEQDQKLKEAKKNLKRKCGWLDAATVPEDKEAIAWAWENNKIEAGMGPLRLLHKRDEEGEDGGLADKLVEWKQGMIVAKEQKESKRSRRLEQRDIEKEEETIVEKYEGRADGLVERTSTKARTRDNSMIKTAEETEKVGPVPKKEDEVKAASDPDTCFQRALNHGCMADFKMPTPGCIVPARLGLALRRKRGSSVQATGNAEVENLQKVGRRIQAEFGSPQH